MGCQKGECWRVRASLAFVGREKGVRASVLMGMECFLFLLTSRAATISGSSGVGLTFPIFCMAATFPLTTAFCVAFLALSALCACVVGVDKMMVEAVRCESYNFEQTLDINDLNRDAFVGACSCAAILLTLEDLRVLKTKKVEEYKETLGRDRQLFGQQKRDEKSLDRNSNHPNWKKNKTKTKLQPSEKQKNDTTDL